MKLIPKLLCGVVVIYMSEQQKDFKMKPFCDCTVWPALYLKKADLEGQNVDYQRFEVQSLKIENKKPLNVSGKTVWL